MEKVLKLSTDGEIKMLNLPEDAGCHWYAEQIGCEWIECVHARGLPKGVVMLIDEEGKLKDGPLINFLGSWFYGTADHGEPIVGDCILVVDSGETWSGFDDETALRNVLHLEALFPGAYHKVKNKLLKDGIMKE